jgi:hypothetical protein
MTAKTDYLNGTNQAKSCKPLKMRSMSCLMKSKPAEFKERPLKNSVIRDRWLNGHVIQANNHGSH